jgi:alkylhydroperoxidase family enzyme
MSRIPLTSIEQQPEPIREFMARRGNLNVFRLLANAPNVFVGWTQMVDELFDSPTFSLRMREVIILRVAHLQGSRYELAQHVGIQRHRTRRARRRHRVVQHQSTARRHLRDSTSRLRRRGAHRVADDHQLLLRAGVGAQRG